MGQLAFAIVALILGFVAARIYLVEYKGYRKPSQQNPNVPPSIDIAKTK